MSKITAYDYKMFDYARNEATKSNYEPYKIGCILVYKHRIIGRGFNSNKTDPTQAKYNKYRKLNRTKQEVKHKIHAEIAAIKSVPYPIANSIDWSKVDLYIYRIASGLPLHQGMARPCNGCIKAIRDAGIVNVYYTTKDGFVQERIF